jgi:hypothetical protein
MNALNAFNVFLPRQTETTHLLARKKKELRGPKEDAS